MPEDIVPESNPTGPQPRRKRSRSRNHGSSGHSSRRHRKSSSSTSTKNKFTVGQALLLVWSAGTLGTLLYLIGDVHRAPISAILGLAGAAILGLFFFFRGLRKKKKKK